MRVFINLAFLSLFCAALTGCGQRKVATDKAVSDKAETPLTVVVATDLHYLSPKLTDYGTGFMRMVGNGDGKLTQYAPELMVMRKWLNC